MAPADDERDGRSPHRRHGDPPFSRDPRTPPQEPDPRRPAPDGHTGASGRHGRRPVEGPPPSPIRRRPDTPADPDDVWGMSGYPSAASGVDRSRSAGHGGGPVCDGAGEAPRDGAGVTGRDGDPPRNGADPTPRDGNPLHGVDRTPRNGAGPARRNSGEWRHGTGGAEGAIGPGRGESTAARNGSRPARSGTVEPRDGVDEPHDGLDQPRNGIGPSPDRTDQPRNGSGSSHDRTIGPRNGSGRWDSHGTDPAYPRDGPTRDGIEQAWHGIEQSPRRGGGSPRNGRDRPGNGTADARNGADQPRNGAFPAVDGLDSVRNGTAPAPDPFDRPRNGTAPAPEPFEQPRNGIAPAPDPFAPPRNGNARPGGGLDQPRNGATSGRDLFDQPRNGTTPRGGAADQPRNGAARAHDGAGPPVDGTVQASNEGSPPVAGVGRARATLSTPRHGADRPPDPHTAAQDREAGSRGIAGHRVDGVRATAQRTGPAARVAGADRTELVGRVEAAERPTRVISGRGRLVLPQDRAASRPGSGGPTGERDHGRRRARPAMDSAAPRRDAGTPPPVGRAARRAAAAAPPPSPGRALLAALVSTVVPGTGLLMIRRTRGGALVLGVFLLTVLALMLVGLTVRRSALVGNLLSSRVLLIVMGGLVLAGLAWVAQVVHTYAVARPRTMTVGRQLVGVAAVSALCLGVAAPFAYAANLVNAQRALLDTLFAGNDGGTSVAVATVKPRLNILLMGSDAGPDRTGARSDTMMVASIDTRTARTTLFGLPRNIGYAPFPAGSALATKFPRGFHDPDGNPTSGNYLLNAVYAYGLEYPQLAPAGPTKDPGLNALNETVSTMLGVDLDYYVEVNMAGFASIIDAVGGVTVDVGPVALPIGGVLPNGVHVKPSGYVPAGVQHLSGEQALWFARSRRDSDDYNRMGRQRCLLQSVLAQKSPADVVGHFQEIASATSNSVSTNVPQEVVGQLVALVGEHTPTLQSVSFDPNLPDPDTGKGFDPNRPDYRFMRQVVQQAFDPTTATATATPPTAPKRAVTDGTQTPADSAKPEALVSSCG